MCEASDVERGSRSTNNGTQPGFVVERCADRGAGCGNRMGTS
jgi:hypothetical protein